MQRKYLSASNSKFGVRQMTVVGMMSAITIVLGFTGYGFVPVPPIKATIMHVPVIIGAVLEGPVAGALIGLIFGMFSLFQNITAPTILSFAMINPIVSVLPRVLIGVFSYYAYKLIKIKSETIRTAFAAFIGTFVNTFGVMGLIYFLYAQKYAQVNKIPLGSVGKVIWGIIGFHGSIEAIVAMFITVPVVISVRKIKNR